MRQRTRTISTLAATLALGAAAGLAVAQAGKKLYINGTLASSDLIERNGKTYAPVNDIARALRLTVTRQGSDYALSPAGGANQIQGLTGKIGETIGNGQFTFVVREIVRTNEYTHQFDGRSRVTKARAGSELVVVVCRLKNATQKTQRVGLAGQNTALTDTEEQGYTQRADYDIRERFGTAQSVLPGSSLNFALLYQVPVGTKLKDFVYQLQVYARDLKKDNFRVSLAQAEAGAP